MNSTHNPNRSLVRIFCISLSGLLLVYAAIGVYGLFQPESTTTPEPAIGLLRIVLALIAVGRPVPLGLVRRAAGEPRSG